MNQLKLKSIIDKYLSGNASVQERNLIDRWFEKEENDGKNPIVENEELRLRILSNINHKIAVHAPVVKKSNIKFLTLLKVAASLFLVSLTTLYFYKGFQHTEVKWTSAATQRGGLKKLILEDGSFVWLNASSKLKFTDEFNGDKREVWLSGEAFFDIKHNKDKPFIIHTNKLTTTVLGTAFNINSYNVNKEVIVTVARGKVGLTSQKNASSAFLTADQKGVFESGKNTVSTSKADASSASAWTTGDFVFKEMSFVEITERLERRFDVSISFSSKKLERCLLTARFRKDASLEEILTILSEIDKSSFVKDNETNKYLISGVGCN